ncbi:retrovirus-related pol polyprotein from transposon TNT 1-94 [Tanacetum coccineum]
MHNNTMVVGSRDRPPMLATGRYAQWQSRFLRYIDTRPNGDALRKFILEGPYTPSTVIILAVPATDDSLEVSERTTVETILNMSLKNKEHYQTEKEEIHLLLTGIGDKIYSTVDACKTAHDMWIAIERLQQISSTTSTRMYQKEINEIRAERIAKNANPLALVATAQQYLEQAQRDKDMQKNLALIAKYFKKIYKPTNNNLVTSSNTRNKNVDTSSRYKNDNQIRQFGNQRTVTVVRAKETECRKPKRVKDYTYHKEKMLLCKQAEKGVPLQAEKADWLADTDEEIDEQELEAYYSYMAKIQEVPTADSGTDTEPLEKVQYDAEYNVFPNERQHFEQPESTSNTSVVEKVDSNVIPNSPNMCDNDIQTDQNAEECDDERVALANLIANLTLDTEENKKILKQLKKANASLTQELKECKSNLEESNTTRDSCLIALQSKQTKLETYMTLIDRTVDYEKLKRKLNETLGLLAQIEIDIKQGLKLKAYEISVVKEKHDELVKQSSLTKSHYEGLVKEKTKVITDLKLKEEKDIDKMISMEKQLKFLNEIVYKRNQSIQTSHMSAPKGSTFNGRPTFANLMYLKKAQSKKPCLYEIPYDTSDPVNRFVPDREEILTLETKSRSKLNKDLVKPYDYTNQNSLYDIFKPASQEYHDQLAHANEVRKKMWRKSFVKSKPKIFKNISFLPTSKSISKSRQAYNVMTNNINHFRELVDQAWEKHSHDHFRAPTAHDMEILIKTCLMPLALKTQNDSFKFVYELKQEMHADLKTNVSRPPLKSTQIKDKVMLNNIQVKFKKTEVEDHHRISSISNKTKSITTCNDSLKSRTSNVNAICATCGKCVFNSNHDACVSKFIHDVNARTKKPKVVPISTRKPKSQANKSVATPHKRAIVQLILFIVDSGCIKHMTGNLKLLCNFVEKYLDLEVAFRKSTCFVIDLQGNDLLTGNRGSDLYKISLQETTSSTLIYFIAKASPTQAWLWHRRLSHLNFDYINLLSKKDIVIGLPKLKYVKDQICSSCEVSKAKRSSFKTKAIPSSKGRLNLLHMDLYGPMRVESINRKKYILVARMMLLASKLPLFFWVEVIATACYTQNRSIIIPTHEKIAYHIINDKKPSIRRLHIFSGTCYLTRDGENLDKMKEKGDPCILVGYSTQSKGYRASFSNDKRRQIMTTLALAPTTKCFPFSRYNSSVKTGVGSSIRHTPTTKIQSSTKPSTPTTNVNVKENNDNQAEDTQFQQDEFINPFCIPVRLVAKGYAQEEGIDIEESFAPVARLETVRDPTIDPPIPTGIFINQAKYALEILKKHGMDKCDRVGTPMATKPKLDADLSGKLVDQTDYRSKIGSLMYLTSSRPDIVQAVCYCARYQARSAEKHLKEVKRIFLYLKGTINMGLWYSKHSGFELIAFSDADHAGCLDTRKSTSGGIQFLGDKLVSWMSKKQNCTAMSSPEAEYVALSASCAQVMWMRTQLKDYGFNYNKISLYCDS